jgi:lysophospholipase L1-like esterase
MNPPPPHSNRPRASLAARLALAAVSLVCALLLGEAVMRFHHAAWPFLPEPREMPHLTGKDAGLRWRFSPRHGRNSLGLKNREVGPKEEHVFRILVLGDSLVWSGETTRGRLYTEIVEENLNAGRIDGPAIEVINAGVPGYTTYQELEFLKVYGLGMEPDLVLLGFVLNDLHYPYLHRTTSKDFLAWEPQARLNRLDPASLAGRLFGWSHLANDLALALRSFSDKLGRTPHYGFEYHNDTYLAWKAHGWKHTERLLGEMQQLLSSRGIPLLVMVFPLMEQMDGAYLDRDRRHVLYPQRRLAEICRDRSLPCLDFMEVISGHGGAALFSDNVHLKPAGNDLVAEQLTRFLAAHLPAATQP